MTEEILKYLTLIGLSAFKFIFGPTLGAGYGLPWYLTGVMTATGMMLTVYLTTFFNLRIRQLISLFRKKKAKRFTKRNRKFVKIWSKYGLKGVAFLTPLLLMPIGGGILANAFSNDKKDIIFWMWVSALFWGMVLSFIIDQAYWLVEGIIL